MLEVWPELPVYLQAFDHPKKQGKDKVVAALRLNHRVSVIRLEKISARGWEMFEPLMHHPFPWLTHLWAQPRLSIQNPISRSFLGGSASCLRDLVLFGVSIPTLPELLLSTTNLVRLWYNDVPLSGYIPPQEIITSLSALMWLESLSLTFHSPRDHPDIAVPIPPPHTRTLLATLTYFRFRGVSKYMEVFASHFEAPSLESLAITLFYQEFLEVSELAKFVHGADKKLSLVDRGEVTFTPDWVSGELSQEVPVWRVDPKTLRINLACSEWNFNPSNLARFCASFFSTYSAFQCVEISISMESRWQDVNDHPDPNWLKLLCVLNTVKHLYLDWSVASQVFKFLRGLPLERFMEVLPALEDLIIPSLEYCLGPLKEEASEFADARQLSGHPVSIRSYRWELRGAKRLNAWEVDD